MAKPFANTLATVALLAAGCEVDVPRNEGNTCFPRGDDANVFSEALENKQLPHHFDTETKCIYYSSKLHSDIEKTVTEVFGTPPPPGLSMSWEDRNDEMEQILVTNGIKVTRYVHYGIEYLAWSYEDHKKAEKVLELKPWETEMLKNFREGK